MVLEVDVPLQFEVLGLDGLVVAQGVFVFLVGGPAGVDGGGSGGGGGGGGRRRGGGGCGGGCVGFAFRHVVCVFAPARQGPGGEGDRGGGSGEGGE